MAELKAQNSETALVKKLHPDSIVPLYQTAMSSGVDLHANLEKPIVLVKGSVSLVSTGIAIQMPLGYEAQVRSRSGLALKNGIFVLNSPGTIDNDYRGEIKVILANFGDSDFKIENGMRIAQMVFCKFNQLKIIESENLDNSDRGSGGFGSTGV